MVVAAGAPILASDVRRALNRATGRGNRTTSKTGITTTSGIVRLDSQDLQADSVYLILASGMRGDSSTNTDINIPSIRYSTAGAATTSSTLLVKGEFADPYTGILLGVLPVATAATYSFLLCHERFGAGTVQLLAEGNGINLICIDLALDPGDTGVDI